MFLQLSTDKARDTERSRVIASIGGKQGREMGSNVWWMQRVAEQL